MDLQTRKIEFIQEFLKISSEEAISMFETLLKRHKKEVENPFSKEELIERIQKAEEDFENGRFVTSDELLKKFS
jgi:hypothetical protein